MCYITLFSFLIACLLTRANLTETGKDYNNDGPENNLSGNKNVTNLNDDKEKMLSLNKTDTESTTIGNVRNNTLTVLFVTKMDNDGSKKNNKVDSNEINVTTLAESVTEAGNDYMNDEEEYDLNASSKNDTIAYDADNTTKNKETNSMTTTESKTESGNDYMNDEEYDNNVSDKNDTIDFIATKNKELNSTTTAEFVTEFKNEDEEVSLSR